MLRTVLKHLLCSLFLIVISGTVSSSDVDLDDVYNALERAYFPGMQAIIHHTWLQHMELDELNRYELVARESYQLWYCAANLIRAGGEK